MHVESDIRFLCSPEADGAGTLPPGAGRAAGPVSRVYEQYETGRKPAPARENLDNPYCFSVGGVGVKIEFAEGGPSLQETLTAFLIRQKSGL